MTVAASIAMNASRSFCRKTARMPINASTAPDAVYTCTKRLRGARHGWAGKIASGSPSARRASCRLQLAPHRVKSVHIPIPSGLSFFNLKSRRARRSGREVCSAGRIRRIRQPSVWGLGNGKVQWFHLSFVGPRFYVPALLVVLLAIGVGLRTLRTHNGASGARLFRIPAGTSSMAISRDPVRRRRHRRHVQGRQRRCNGSAAGVHRGERQLHHRSRAPQRAHRSAADARTRKLERQRARPRGGVPRAPRLHGVPHDGRPHHSARSREARRARRSGRDVPGRRRRGRSERRGEGNRRIPAPSAALSTPSADASPKACCSSDRQEPARPCSPARSRVKPAFHFSSPAARTSSRCTPASARRASAGCSATHAVIAPASCSSTSSTPSGEAAAAARSATKSASRRSISSSSRWTASSRRRASS